MLASSIDVMLKSLSVAHCYSLTAPAGIATGCLSLFFFFSPEIFELNQCTVSILEAPSESGYTFNFREDPLLYIVSTSVCPCMCGV